MAVEEVTEFSSIEAEFMTRVADIVWCSAATLDRQGRLRSRILHPIWELVSGNPLGWIATGRHTLKTKHLAANPWLSLSYWNPEHKQIYADCKAEWEDDQSEKRRIWELYQSTPAPLGYNLKMIWQGLDDPTYGLLKLQPWRIEMSSLQDLTTGALPRVWRASTQ